MCSNLEYVADICRSRGRSRTVSRADPECGREPNALSDRQCRCERHRIERPAGHHGHVGHGPATPRRTSLLSLACRTVRAAAQLRRRAHVGPGGSHRTAAGPTPTIRTQQPFSTTRRASRPATGARRCTFECRPRDAHDDRGDRSTTQRRPAGAVVHCVDDRSGADHSAEPAAGQTTRIRSSATSPCCVSVGCLGGDLRLLHPRPAHVRVRRPNRAGDRPAPPRVDGHVAASGVRAASPSGDAAVVHYLLRLERAAFLGALL